MAISILSGQKKVDDTTEDEKSGAPSPTIQAVGGGESAFTTATPTSATKTTKPSPIKGSGYTNIQKIMAASGAGGGPTRLAGTVAGGIGATTAGAAGAFKAAKEEYGSKVETAGQEVGSGLSKGQSIISGASKGETPDVQTFGTLTSGTYQAPEFQMSPEAKRRAAESSALAQLAGQAGGRGAILQRYVRAPQYNVAQQRMDELLLGKGGSAAIRGALRQGAKLEADVGRQEAVAKEQAKQLQAQAAGIAGQLKTELGTARETFGKTLSDREKSKEEELLGAYDRIVKALTNPNVSTEDISSKISGGAGLTYRPKGAGGIPHISRADLRLLGLSEADFTNLATSLDPTKYLTSREDLQKLLGEIGKEAYASEADLAAASALGALAGEKDLGISGLGDFYKRKEGLVDFDLSRYQEDLNIDLDMSEAEKELARERAIESMPSIRAGAGASTNRIASDEKNYMNFIPGSRTKTTEQLAAEIFKKMNLHPNSSVFIDGKSYSSDQGAFKIAEIIKSISEDPKIYGAYNTLGRKFTFID